MPLTVYHIPVCPFCQRLEILLDLKGVRDEVQFELVDITKPRDPVLLAKTDGTTALPVVETDDGLVLKESLVLMEYLDAIHEPRIARQDPAERAIEQMLVAMASPFVEDGYRFAMNQDRERRDQLREKLVGHYARFDAFLRKHNPDGIWLFDEFGYAEAVFTSFFQRFWMHEYYDDFDIPNRPEFERVRRWRDNCRAHPAAQQATREEIVKVYYDYVQGVGNGGLPPGRERSSFVLEPSWQERPWPPADKYGTSASDAELGLTQ